MNQELPPPPEGINPKRGSRPAPEGYYYIPPTQYAHTYIPYEQARVAPTYMPPPPMGTRKQQREWKKYLRKQLWEEKSVAAKLGTILVTIVAVFFIFTMIITLLGMLSGSDNTSNISPTPTSTAHIAGNPNDSNTPEHWFD